jgi:hypothetical protein
MQVWGENLPRQGGPDEVDKGCHSAAKLCLGNRFLSLYFAV